MNPAIAAPVTSFANTRPLVLLHGWAMTPAVWSELSALLAPRPIAAPTLPGHGGEAAPAEVDLAAWADAVAERIPEGAVLGGWSLGAMLALQIAGRHPHKVSRLLLLGATPRFVAAADWTEGLAPDTVAAFRTGFDAAPAATLKRFLALQGLGDTRGQRVRERLLETLSPHAESARPGLADGLRLLAASDLRDRLDTLVMPCCIVHGAHDALMPVGAARWLAAALPRARLHLLPDCGHACFLSQPAACAQLIERFLDD